VWSIMVLPPISYAPSPSCFTVAHGNANDENAKTPAAILQGTISVLQPEAVPFVALS
jgi:hypothetical protein